MPFGRALLCSLALSPAACGDDSTRWVITLPDTDAKSYALQITRDDGAVPDVFVGAVSEPFIREYALDTEEIQLELILYPESMSEMGIDQSGRLLPGQECRRSCELASSTVAAYRSTLRIDERPMWARTTRSDALVERLLPDFEQHCFSPCTNFVVEEVELPTKTFVSVAVATSDERGAIVGLADGGLYRIGHDLSVERLCLESGSERISQGARGEGDDLWWLLGGQIQRIDLDDQDPDQPCVVATSTAPSDLAGRLRHIGGGPLEGGGFELVVMTEDTLYRFDGSVWRRLGALPQKNVEVEAWVSWTPGRALMTNGTSEYVLVDGDNASVMAPPLPNAALRASVIFEASAGLVLGSDAQGVASRRGAEWKFELPAWWSGPGSMVAHDGGVFLGLDFGTFAQFFHDTGMCPMNRVPFSAERVYRLASFGDKVVLADVVTHETRSTVVAVARPGSRCE